MARGREVIEFLTFFLGTIRGVQNLEVVAGPEVVRVEIRLDERVLGELRSAPWRTIVDFGPALQPHEVVAVAYDAASAEVGRARQWVNRPRARAEAAIVLGPTVAGKGRRARVTWHSITGPEPLRWSLTFDGEPLAVASLRDFELPPHEPRQVHFVRAMLEFGQNVTAVADAVFGGPSREETLTELTAVPVLMTAAKLPELKALDRLLTDGREVLRVVAAEEGTAEVVFVMDHNSWAAIWEMNSRFLTNRARYDFALEKDQKLRFLWAVPELVTHSGFSHRNFPMSEDLTKDDGGVPFLASRIRRIFPSGENRTADAVAAAGLSAAGHNFRRAVVLVLGREMVDRSEVPPAEARRYLERLGVPLFVWSVVPPGERTKALEWWPVEDASTRSRLGRAVDRLTDHLEDQRIIWVEGSHLPQRVAVAASAPFTALASDPRSPPSVAGRGGGAVEGALEKEMPVPE